MDHLNFEATAKIQQKIEDDKKRKILEKVKTTLEEQIRGEVEEIIVKDLLDGVEGKVRDQVRASLSTFSVDRISLTRDCMRMRDLLDLQISLNGDKVYLPNGK